MAQQQYNSSLANHLQRQCSMSPSPHAGWPRRREREGDEHRRRMPRNRSMVNMRSQLLHRTLVEELNRRLFFNTTVGAVENIGFRAPVYSAEAAARGRVDHRSRRRRDEDNKRHQYIML